MELQHLVLFEEHNITIHNLLLVYQNLINILV